MCDGLEVVGTIAAAVIAACAGWLVAMKQLKQSATSAIIQEASRASIEEYKLRIELAKLTNQPVKMRPLILHIFANVSILRRVNAGTLTDSQVREIHLQYEMADKEYWRIVKDEENHGLPTDWDYPALSENR